MVRLKVKRTVSRCTWIVVANLNQIMCVIYDQRCSGFQNRRTKYQTRLIVEVTIELKTYKYAPLQPQRKRTITFCMMLLSDVMARHEEVMDALPHSMSSEMGLCRDFAYEV
ncbi:hypothetical protein CR513_41288, partial [Mucuna pruriens]